MKIEIWSDVACPFCYIGKRKFEQALDSASFKDQIEVEWKSFQLMPDLQTQPEKSMNKMLADVKGFPLEQAEAMNQQVTEMAKSAGLEFHIEKAIPANTFRAHQLLHFAKQAGKQNEAEEALFSALFVEGKNVDDVATLLAIGSDLGLDTAALQTAIDDSVFTKAVHADIQEAQQIGVRGVPFFVFDRKYAVSGAQDTKAFAEVIDKSFGEWQAAQGTKALDIINGNSCAVDGNCD